MAAPNQFLMYDAAMLEWMKIQFGAQLEVPTHFLVGTPDRGFAEAVTPNTHSPREGRPPLPRCSLTLEDPEIDNNRFNPNILRNLGYTASDKLKVRQAFHPVPVNLPYTINFWTEKYREMNLFEQQILKWFKFGYNQLTVDIDSISPVPIYGKKWIELYRDSAIMKTGDEEPGNNGERYIRRTMQMHMKAWIWDMDFVNKYVVKEVELQTYRDENLTLLFEIVRTPIRSVIAFANGTDTTFGPIIPDRLPIIPGTLLVDATIAGQNVRVTDNGSGVILDLVDSMVSGTVNYTTGAISLTYTAAPDAGSSISAGYYTRL